MWLSSGILMLIYIYFFYIFICIFIYFLKNRLWVIPEPVTSLIFQREGHEAATPTKVTAKIKEPIQSYWKSADNFNSGQQFYVYFVFVIGNQREKVKKTKWERFASAF